MALFDSIRLGSSAAGDYEIERSLRFNRSDDPQLQRTASSTSNTFTFSTWLKRASLSTYQYFFSVGGQGLLFSNDDGIRVNSDGGANTSTAKFRDLSAWYHVVLSMSSGSATVYVNNVACLSSVSGFSLSTSTNYLKVGWLAGDAGEFNFDGYLAETQLIDGTALTPSSFAETDALTGEYKPKRYGGGYGTSGFLLNYSDNSGTTATTLGKDSSGNGNNFTPNNFATTDVVKDSPTNNFCTLNAIQGVYSATGTNTYSEGNLKVSTPSSGTGNVFGNMSFTSGKWYAEAYVAANTGLNRAIVGASGGVIDTIRAAQNIGTNAGAIDVSYFGQTGVKNISGSESSYGDTYTVGDIIGVALDLDNRTINFYKNNTAQGTITIASTGDWAIGTGDTSGGAGSTMVMNYGQDSSFASAKTAQGNVDGNGKGDFYYSPPSGFVAMCSANFPDPSIKLPAQHFNTLLYTGTDTSANRTLSGLEFSPDFVWQKRRNGTNWHTLMDTVRGVGKTLFSNDASTEASNNQYGYVSAFTSDGFTWSAGSTNNSDGNETNGTFVAWNWKAGGSASSNSDGTRTASVSANTTAGFSIGTFTAQSSGSATVGHGLGVAPDVVITKSRTLGDYWYIYHKSIGQDGWILFTSGAATTGNSAVWNPAPTSSVFTYGSGLVNQGDIVFYAFSEVAGYSKFGSYKGNGSTDGTFVFTGFRPAWILVKRTASENWALWDNKRDSGINPNGYLLRPDSNTDEGGNVSGHQIDILSNGFKIRNSDTKSNGNGDTYIYLCFAESPFKYSRAR